MKMEREAELSGVAKCMAHSKQTPPIENLRLIETPVGLRRLTEDNMDKEFSGFRDKKGNIRSLLNIERELRYLKEVMLSVMDKQDRLTIENTELRLRLVKFEKINVINQGLKEEIQEIKKQNVKTTKTP
ncbi:hypothetical protein E2C01_080858 [Portunus trituberculatus]|uniref:Uncharacterized protein n=1 Tax=Portunus trituberculatus TaxID=210409 RepID=A0A5B7IWH2_PORTR|nr:hypothetical protein [Portunus trituberculatus]